MAMFDETEADRFVFSNDVAVRRARMLLRTWRVLLCFQSLSWHNLLRFCTEYYCEYSKEVCLVFERAA